MSKRESVLVIVLAETREYEHTFDLFKKNLLDAVEGDLCLCVANNHRENPDNPFYTNARYVWTYDEPDDWGDAFDAIQRERGLQENWRILLTVKDQWLGGIKGAGAHPGSAGILLFFRYFLRQSIIEHGILEDYDRYIITRSDFVHRIPHVPLKLLDPDFIWIPDGENYGGYTDRHIVVPRSEILRVLSITDKLMTAPETLCAEMAFWTTWNFEQYIKFAFRQLKLRSRVRRYPYTMYAVRSAGGHTRWQRGRFDEELGYNIKYENEYRSYKLAAESIQEQGDWSHFRIHTLLSAPHLKIPRFLKDTSRRVIRQVSGRLRHFCHYIARV